MNRMGLVFPGALLAVVGALYLARSAAAEEKKAVETPSVLVQSVPARLVPMKSSLIAYGTVEYAPEYSQVVSLQGEGVVKQVLVTAGQPVRAGDPLLRLIPTANASLEIERAHVDLVFARKTLERVQELKRRQLTTNADVQAAEEGLSKAQAVFDQLRKRYVGQSGLVVHADKDGVVEAVLIQEGQIAAPGAPLLRLADGNRLRVRLGVEPEDLPKLRVGQLTQVRPLHPGATAVTGKVSELFRQVNPRTRLAEAVVPLPAASRLLPGISVQGEILLRPERRVLAVPRTAVLYDQGKGYVFVVEKGIARRKIVETGRNNDRSIEILKGLSSGKLVVTVGNYELSDGMRVRLQGSR
jgi:membrane fusion protein, multidrug efflux system